MKLDEVCSQLSKEVIIFIKEWIKISGEDEASFHRFRMKLLDMASKSGPKTKDKLIELCKRSGARIEFELKEVVSDKLIGDTVAGYIFARLILALNYEYLDILERESEVMKRENDQLKVTVERMSNRLGVH